MAKKKFVLRIDEDLYTAIEKWAADEFRSVNGQLEWIIPLKMDDQSGRLVKVDMQVPAPKFIAWGGYLGTEHDGIYHTPLSYQTQP